MRKTQIIGVLLVIALLLLGTCTPTLPADTTPPTLPTDTTPKPPEAAFLTLETELVGNKLTICGETNLPNDSKLGVSVSRLYKCRGDNEWYISDVALDHTVTVENGGYSDIWVIDESWYDWLQSFYRNTGNPLIVKVSDELSVRVIFTPKRQQPDSVYEILGQNAENLKGEQVESVGTFYILEANAEVYFPFTK